MIPSIIILLFLIAKLYVDSNFQIIIVRNLKIREMSKSERKQIKIVARHGQLEIKTVFKIKKLKHYLN